MPRKPATPLYKGRPHEGPATIEVRKSPILRGLSHYGNAEIIRFIADFQEKDRRAGHKLPLRYTRTCEAVMKKFKCSESTAKANMRALVAYRMDCFVAELPGFTIGLVEDHMRVAAKAESEGRYFAAIAARREAGRLVGAYGPNAFRPAQSTGPSLRTQLAAVLAILPVEQRVQLEGILLTVEQAVAAGQLKIEGEGEDPGDPSAIEVQGTERSDTIEGEISSELERG